MALLGGLIAGVVIGGLAYRRAPATPEWVRLATTASGFVGGLWLGWVLISQLLT